MSINLIIFEELVEFQVHHVLWVPDPEDYLEIHFTSGDMFLLFRGEDGVDWERVGTSLIIQNWDISLPHLIGEANGTPLTEEQVLQYLFGPEAESKKTRPLYLE